MRAIAVAVSRSRSERPEPSAITTPASGMFASASTRRTTAAPAAVVPPAPDSAPRSLSSISARKLSLSRSMTAITLRSVADSLVASSVAVSGARPTPTGPVVTP